MKKWLAKVIVDVLLLVVYKIHDWFFSEELAARVRYKLRVRWHNYSQKAEKTKSTRDDMRAKSMQTLMKFETLPADAVARGDYNPGK